VKFAKLICRSPNAILQKKLHILFAQKSRANVLVKLIPKCKHKLESLLGCEETLKEQPR